MFRALLQKYEEDEIDLSYIEDIEKAVFFIILTTTV